jgi:hypothetical protein
MIDIALSNYNSQGIQDLLENNLGELMVFLQDENNECYKVRALVSFTVSEHMNIKNFECKTGPGSEPEQL